MCRIRNPIRCLALFLALLAGAATAQDEPTPRELERQIVDGLVRQQEVAPLVERWLEVAKLTPSQAPQRPLAQAGRELRDALAGLRAARPGEVMAAYDAVRAADLLLREHFASASRRLAAAGVGGEVAERLAAARSAYAERMAGVLGPFAALPAKAEASSVSAARAAARPRLDELLAPSPAPILRASVLPYRPTALAARPPRREPAIVPSYADPSAAAPAAADLAPTPAAPFDEEILALAAELGHDYVAIYEHVRNEIDHQWYAGSMKGAVGTLAERAGNSLDQASLLIALLRASQLPARYVHGVVELPVETVAAELGLADASRVPAALARAGVAHAPLVRGGRVAAVEVEATWVAAYLPYGNYRGAVVDFSGRTWLPLLPAFKSYQRQPSTAVLREMALDVDAKLAEHLAAVQPRDLLADLRDEVGTYLLESAPGATYEEQLGARSIVPEGLGLVPNTLTVPVTGVIAEEPSLSPAEQVRVRFVVRSGADAASPVALDAEIPLAALAGRRVTLSYLPATVDDHVTVNAFGGLSGVPLYLVRVRPQLKVAGRPAVVGEGVLELGAAHLAEVEIAGPAGRERIEQRLVSGSYHALAFGVAGLPRQVPAEGDLADTESQAASILAGVALSLNERWSAGEDELAGLLDVEVLRPLPALAVAASAVAVETVAELPFQLRFQGVTLDAALRVAEPLARGADAAAARDFLRLSALYGSSLEHRLFESGFLVESISADKALALARQDGLEVLRFEQDPSDPRLATLAHPEEVRDDVANWLRLGMTVEIPAAPVSLNAWSGSAWRVEEPATGGAAYLISGGLAGGATSEPPTSWVLELLAQALSSPYSAEPNPDPRAGARVDKLPGTDGQVGTVGEELPLRLGVRVTDAYGQPVEKAAVTFVGLTGAGFFLDELGAEHPSLTVETDRAGIARARFRLGEVTAVEPTFLAPETALGERHATRALSHWVDALVDTRGGVLTLADPLRAIGRPGEPAALRRLDTNETEFFGGAAGQWVDTIPMSVEDAFGNPVSNVPVTFTVAAMEPFEGCANAVGPRRNAEVFAPIFDAADPEACAYVDPGLGECGSLSQLTRRTTYLGATAGFILGNEIAAAYSVDVGTPELEPRRYSYSPLFGQLNTNGICTPVESRIALQSSSTLSYEGFNYTAARAGQELAYPVQVTLSYWLADPWIRYDLDDPDDELAPPVQAATTGEWVRTQGTVEFLVSNDGSVTPPVTAGPGLYETRVTTGLVPGENEVVAEATDVLTHVWKLDDQAWVERREEVLLQIEQVRPELFGDRVTTIWGLEPQITEIVPEPLVLNDHSRTAGASYVRYQIVPEHYVARDAWVEVTSSDTAFTGAGTSRAGAGEVLIQPSFPFDVEHEHQAELVLNRGTPAEVRSDEVDVPLRQSIVRRIDSSDGFLRDATEGVFVSQEVDVLNQSVCATGTEFIYELHQEARVTLTFKKVDSINPDGSKNLGAETVLIRDELKSAGEHRLLITPADLPAGDYKFALEAVATLGGDVEVVPGEARSEYRSRDSLPIGHTLVKGVDLFDGHLVVSRQDFTFPGRGVPLAFQRTYSSSATAEPGPLGAGWSHNYDSRLTITPCGEVILIGGEGSGLRFAADGSGGLRPLKGHHGTLIPNLGASDEPGGASSFDFYTKSGNHYRYVFGGEGEWVLKAITDPDGNKTELLYGGEPGELRVTQVRDAAGRTLDFEYERRTFVFWTTDVITRVSAPGGVELRFEYDRFGNLARASREAIASEQYVYLSALPGAPLEERHLLAQVIDEATSATTSYTYEHGVIGVQGDVTVASDFVRTVTLPEGGVTTFDYDTAALLGRATALTATVTDGRGFPTVYTLNQHGNTVSMVDPEENETLMEWAADDVVMTARVDGNGVRTEFTYDEHGNLLTEVITVTDVDGEVHEYVSSTTYHPPSLFDPPYVKERIATRTDRNGHTTHFTYDGRGNLTEERIAVGNVDDETTETLTTTHTYDSRGDRRSTTNPRGHTRFFTYDGFGNLATVTDPLGGVVTTDYDVRSRPIRRLDELRRETLYEYDTLGRPTRRVLPKVEGEAQPPEEQMIYDDAARTRTEIDAAGRATITRLDRQGRTVEVENAVGATKVLAYDEEGNKTLESTWFDDVMPRYDLAFTYDRAGRLTRRTEPLGRVTSFAYDDAGNVVAETLFDDNDPSFAPRVTETDYDALNRPIELRRKIDETWATTRIKYDGEGNRILEIDPLGRQTSHRYDALNRLLETIEPEWSPGQPRTTQYVYDGNGNVVETRLDNEPDDQIRRMEYDALDRVVARTDALGNRTTVEYDAVDNVTREIDPLLNTTSHAYDARNRRIRTTVHLNRVTNPPRNVETTFVYDAVGNLIEEHHPNGNVVVHTYDDLDRLTSTVDSLGPVTTRDYDARGNVVFEADAKGNETLSIWDALDRLVQQNLPEDRVVRFTYDVAGNRTSETNARGFTTTFRYDELNRRVEVIDPQPFGYSSTSTYDLAGNLLTESDRRDNTTTYEYDDLDRLVRRLEPPLADGTRLTTEMTYDAAGNRLTETDRRGILTELSYDAESRRVRTVRAGIELERLDYDGNGNVILQSDANGHLTSFEHDERNLVVAESRPLAAITRRVYDDMGDVVRVRDPEGRITVRGYDLRRRMTSETRAAESERPETTVFDYDLNGNRILMRRPEGNEWTYDYDGADRLVTVTDPEQGVTTYTWDQNGNPKTQTDANQNTTTFTYDELDRSTRKEYADGAFETSAYDENGNLVEHRDANGRLTTFTFDALNRQTLAVFSEDPSTADDLQSIARAYDANNNLVAARETYSESGDQVTTRTYDAFDRLETVTDRWGNVLRYAYDANGNRTQLTDPSRQVTTYAYDALNRLSAVTTTGGVTEYAYLRDSRVREIRYPSGTTASYTYDEAGRTSSIDNRHNGALVSYFSYRYDLNGNRVEQIEERSGQSAETTTYAYDLADRLLEVVYPEKTTTYTYDAVGNRRTEQEIDTGGASITNKVYTYNDRNQLEQLDNLLDSTRSVTYGYDANGNQISRSTGTGEVTDLAFDVLDRLVRLETDGIPIGTYLYDAQGMRIEKLTAEDSTRYVYDDSSVLTRTDDAGITKYEYGPDRLLSVNHPTEGRAYYVFDALGSVVNLTTSQGTLLARYKYDAWGNYREVVDTDANPFGFTGHEHDSESGLIYAKARFYDAEIGLFLSEDPIDGDYSNPPSLHRYLYAFQNPTVFFDPDGSRSRVLNLASPSEISDNITQLERAEADILKAWDEIREVDEAVNALSSKPYDPTTENRRVALTKLFERKVEVLARINELDAEVKYRFKDLENDLAFLGEVAFVVEKEDSPGAQRDALRKFLNDEKGLKSDAAARLAGEFLGPGACEDESCRVWKEVGDRSGPYIRYFEALLQQELLLIGGELVLPELLVSESAPMILRGLSESGAESRASLWTSRHVLGRRVYQRNDLFDPIAVDANGLSNLQRMQRGRPPIGYDGEPVNLHHLTQTEPGSLAEVGGQFHSQNSKVLHGLTEPKRSFRFSPDGKTTDAERAFRRYSYKYWQERAKELER